MQIVIPMSGSGQRFLDAGYTLPKPLIEVDGRPMIEYVLKMFPGEENFIFICRDEHLKTTNMREILTHIAPKCQIIESEPAKKGPVYAVSKAFDLIEDEGEVIVSYCDFSKYYDYKDFLKHTRDRDADGAITSYRGYHPHMLYPTNYAFQRSENQWMLEIREKEPFTDNRMEEFASDGMYYFKRGSDLKKYYQRMLDEDINLNGEYYSSLPYNLMVADGLKVSIYKIQHMLQWGTPRDMEEYQQWSDYFRAITETPKNIEPPKKSISLIPMAGRGSRFTAEGYTTPKPLIEVSGKPMVIQAAVALPKSEKHIFVCLKEHLDNYPIEKEIKAVEPNAKIIPLSEVTEGQACTCELGLKDEDLDSPLVIAPSDWQALWDADKYSKLINDGETDAIVWSFKHSQMGALKPEAYGWIAADENDTVTEVSVKKPVSDEPYNDHGVLAIFSFRKVSIFLEGLKYLYDNNIRVNNEFYVDSVMDALVKMGKNVKVFEASHYLTWGTPDEFKMYEYWQSFFHKCDWHPYTVYKDVFMNTEKASEYAARYEAFEQESR